MRPKAQFAYGVGWALICLYNAIWPLTHLTDAWGRATGLAFLAFIPPAIYDAWIGFRRMRLQKVSPANQDADQFPIPRWSRAVGLTITTLAASTVFWSGYRSGAYQSGGSIPQLGTIVSFVALISIPFLLVYLIWRDRPTSQSNLN